jgi:hypothetical protein
MIGKSLLACQDSAPAVLLSKSATAGLATITLPEAHTDLFRMTERARNTWNVPSELVPICEDNADYYCMTPDGRVIFWSHEMQAPSGVEWSDLASWIEEVWMYDYDAT